MAAVVRVLALIFVLCTARVSLSQRPEEKRRGLDSLRLPPGTVILVTPDPRSSNPNIDAVILTPEEYQKLLDNAERLQKLTTPGDESIPAVCRLAIAFDSESNTARIKANYQFRTNVAQSTIQLGLQKTRPISATLENKQTPTLIPTPDGGYQFKAETVGEYRLSIEAICSIQRQKNNTLDFEIGLPGSAITVLEKFELPTHAMRLRINDHAVITSKNDSAIVLGPAKTLTAAWEVSPVVKPGVAVIAVESRIAIRLEDRQVVTHASLNVGVLRGQVAEFQLTAPPNAKVTTPDNRSITIEPPNETRRTTWLLKRNSSADDLQIEVSLQQPMTRRPLLAYGFPIAGAISQRGNLAIKIPDTYRFSLIHRIELIRRDTLGTNDGGELYEFATISPNGQLAELELQPARGEIESGNSHTLQLTETAWKLSSRFEIRPVRKELDRLELDIPSDLRDIRVGPADIIDASGAAVDLPNGRKILPLRLIEPTRKSISLTFDGNYPISPETSAASFQLPRLNGASARGGHVQVSTSPGIEVRGEVRQWDRDHVGDWQHPLEPGSDGQWNAALEHSPAQIDLSWRPAASANPIQSTVDIDFDAQKGVVRQAIKFPISPRQFVLNGPAELADRVIAVEGGTISVSAPGVWVARPHSPASRESTFVLSYTFGYDSSTHSTLPLLWIENTPRYETEIRLWAAPGAAGPQFPVIDSSQWIAVAPPVIKDRPRLPAIAARTSAVKVPLVIHFGEVAPNLPVAIIDRVWIRATVDEVGAVNLRTRFLARPVRNEPLAIRLPGPPMLLRPSVRLDGRAIDVQFQNQQLLVPLGPSGGEHIVEVFCTLPARSGWNVRIDAPKPAGPIVIGAVRWQIRGPDGDAGFETSGELSPIVRWSWYRGLLTPTPGISEGAMVRWFAGEQAQVAVEPFDATMTATSTGIPTVWITFWPRTAITVIASLVALAVGGILIMIQWTFRRCALLIVGVVLLFLTYSAWPQVIGQFISFCQPGLWVLIPAGMVGTWVRRRSARQAVFAPLRIVVPQGPTVIAKTAV